MAQGILYGAFSYEKYFFSFISAQTPQHRGKARQHLGRHTSDIDLGRQARLSKLMMGVPPLPMLRHLVDI